jgi:hypothetical protein
MLTININQTLIFNVILIIGLFSIIVIDSKLILNVLMSIESMTRAVKEYFKEKGEKVKKAVKGLGEKVKKAVKGLGEKLIEIRPWIKFVIETCFIIASMVIMALTLIVVAKIPPSVSYFVVFFFTFPFYRYR